MEDNHGNSCEQSHLSLHAYYTNITSIDAILNSFQCTWWTCLLTAYAIDNVFVSMWLSNIQLKNCLLPKIIFSHSIPIRKSDVFFVILYRSTTQVQTDDQATSRYINIVIYWAIQLLEIMYMEDNHVGSYEDWPLDILSHLHENEPWPHWQTERQCELIRTTWSYHLPWSNLISAYDQLH